jgi:hypothetical protein
MGTGTGNAHDAGLGTLSPRRRISILDFHGPKLVAEPLEAREESAVTFCGFPRNLSAKLTSHDALDIDTCLGSKRAVPVPDCLHALPNIHVEIATFMPTLELPWMSCSMICWASMTASVSIKRIYSRAKIALMV